MDTGARIRCDPLTSELDNLMLDPSVKPRAEAGTDVDSAAEEGHQVSLQGHEVEQGAPRLKVHEQVEVARVVGRVAGHGAEDAQMARTVATSDCDEVSTPRAKLTDDHSRRADAAPNCRTSSSFRCTCWASPCTALGSPPCSAPLARA